MEKNLGLKADSLGGYRMVITPVAPPPSFKEVWSWCRAKKLYETMKAEQETLKPREIIKKENKDQSESESSSRVLSKAPAKSAIKKTKAPSPEPEIIDDDDDERGTSCVISPSPPAKRIKTRSSQVNTSTPRRRVPLEKEFPPCTPIQRSGSSLDSVTPSPTTPRSSTVRSTRRVGGIIPPATPGTSKGRADTPPITPTSSRGLRRLSLKLSQRRLSSGMEASLRRLLVASQLKVCV